MKAVILESYVMEEGDLDWSGVKALVPDTTSYVRTAYEEIAPRIGVADIDFRNHRAEPEFHGRGIWWTDGKTIKQWKRDWGEKAQYIMCQRPKLSAMLLAPSGPYQPYTLASHTDQFESDVRKVLKSEWMYQYDNHLNFPWEVRQWEIVNRYPMAESLVKTGWADALCSQVYDEYEHSTRINLRAETYYGVFGLNRQELAAVSQSKKSFREVDNALEWKEAGLAINGKNMAMTMSTMAVVETTIS